MKLQHPLFNQQAGNQGGPGGNATPPQLPAPQPAAQQPAPAQQPQQQVHIHPNQPAQVPQQAPAHQGGGQQGGGHQQPRQQRQFQQLQGRNLTDAELDDIVERAIRQRQQSPAEKQPAAPTGDKGKGGKDAKPEEKGGSENWLKVLVAFAIALLIANIVFSNVSFFPSRTTASLHAEEVVVPKALPVETPTVVPDPLNEGRISNTRQVLRAIEPAQVKSLLDSGIKAVLVRSTNKVWSRVPGPYHPGDITAVP